MKENKNKAKLRFNALKGSDKKIDFSKADKNLLEAFPYENYKDVSQVVTFYTDEFTCICPITSQPDFAKLEILYIPDKLGVESKSLKLYLFSYRNHGSFHEDTVNRITNDLKDLIKPKYLRVIGDFTKRGGIAIKPISIYKKTGSKIDESLIENYDRNRN